MLDKVTKKRLAKRMANRSRDKLSTEQRESIAKRYANNESAQSIADDYGVSLVTVYKWVNKAAGMVEQ
jgi:transposase-like protein